MATTTVQYVCANTECQAQIHHNYDSDEQCTFRMCSGCQSAYCGACVAQGHVYRAGTGDGGWHYPVDYCAACFLKSQTDRSERGAPLLERTTVDFHTGMLRSIAASMPACMAMLDQAAAATATMK
jgi:hypothetical protein